VKRTDLEVFGDCAERLRTEEEGVRGLVDLAWAKSGSSEGLLGLVMIDEAVVVGKPRNWEVKSSNWDRRWFA
jgi:hypothetical protein